MRAMRLRCPHCGGGPIFTSWSRLLPVCPVCGLGLERGEDGYWLGAYFFNLMAMETVFSVWVVGFLLETWPDPPPARSTFGVAALPRGAQVEIEAIAVRKSG